MRMRIPLCWHVILRVRQFVVLPPARPATYSHPPIHTHTPLPSFDIKDVVIVSGARTPIAAFRGALGSFTAPQLGSLVIAGALQRAGVDAGVVQEVYMGNVCTAGVGQAPARQAALGAGEWRTFNMCAKDVHWSVHLENAILTSFTNHGLLPPPPCPHRLPRVHPMPHCKQGVCKWYESDNAGRTEHCIGKR